MTLILTLGNREQFIQLSDRRLSSSGNPVDEESNKAALLFCANARLIYGYSGLAKAGAFSTDRWLLDSLYECGPPDFTAYNILERLKVKATTDFTSIPEIKNLSDFNKRLSIIFSGYLYAHTPPLGAYAIITNHEDFKNNVQSKQAWEKFESTYWKEKRPINEEYSLVQRIGMGTAMNSDDESALRKLLLAHKPAKAIIEKGVEVIRKIAERSEAKGTIGKQISSVCLPLDPNKTATTGYHTNHPTHDYYMPNMVVNINNNQRSVFANVHVRPEVCIDHPPVVVQKVRRNEPCPCRRGLKYRYCHGR